MMHPLLHDSTHDETTDAGKKTMRKRRKKMFAEIRELVSPVSVTLMLTHCLLLEVEFYFSESNLRNDQYLKQLMMRSAGGTELVGDEAVPLAEIVRFNKIRCLTTNEEDVRRALRSSDVLTLTPDSLSVRRKQAVDFDKNVDALTIYVENLPHDVTHDWLKRLFSPYGPVLFISIPKFKDKRVKGFAFIEFSSETAVRDACRAFRAQVPPANLMQSETPVVNCETQLNEMADELHVKRKIEPESDDDYNKSKRMKSDVIHDSMTELNQNLNVGNGRQEDPQKGDAMKLGLRVMSKQEWSEWKRKYRKLQAENMKKVKQVIRQEAEADIPSSIAAKLANLISPSAAATIASKESSAEKDPISVIKLSVRIKESEVFEEAVYKKRIRELADPISLAYVDVDKSGTEFLEDRSVVHTCFIRCHSRSDAESLSDRQAFQSLGSAVILDGDDEDRYRKRMMDFREQQKRKSENKNHKGYKKWVQRATHVLKTEPAS